MLPYPQIDPVALAIGPLKIHWYGLMYLIGIGAAWLILSRRLNRFDPTWTKEKLSDMVFWMSMGVIVGGRLGYVLFYKPAYYLANPAEILAVWQGGMAFHGGFLGVLVAMWLFGRKTHRPWLAVTDFIAPLVPLGLAAGRLGNFINAQSSRDNVIGAILDVYFDKTTQPDGSVSIAIRDPKLHCVISQYEAGYKNIRVIPYSQYTDELGAAHGEFTLSREYIESMLRSTIDEEFLTLD